VGVCTHGCMYTCMHVGAAKKYMYETKSKACMCVLRAYTRTPCIYLAYIYTMYVYTYIHIYIYIFTHTNTQTDT
jgi:hypothetical protein